MNRFYRRSPIAFPGKSRTEIRSGHEVALEYEGQGDGPWLVDLSHKPKWDLQDRSLDSIRPWGCSIPERPGQCLFHQGLSINRMNRTQAQVWDLAGHAGPLDEYCATDISDGLCLLAFVPSIGGQEGPALMERITPLDIYSPNQHAPCLIQGPVLHIPCQIVRLTSSDDRGVVLIAFSRGYGQSMAEALLDAGEDIGLRPGGEDVFARFLSDA